MQLWTKEYPEAVQNKLVEFVPFDFFKDAPVSECDIYYVGYSIICPLYRTDLM